MSKEMGKRIRQKRLENELTLEELGNLLEVSKSTVSKWEHGEVQDIGRKKIAKMAEIFNCKASWLMGLNDAPKVDLTYAAPGKESVRVTVEGDPIIGESSLRVKILQEAAKVRQENLQAAIDILKSLQ